MTTKTAIGFCGLGAMGFGMAVHLVKQGYPVTGFDVWQPTLDKFKAAGGIPSNSLSESAKDKNFYVVMVATAQQAQQAVFDAEDGGIISTLPQNATLILCSTVPSSYALQMEKQLMDVGRSDVHFIDAPVSGGAIRAADGTLSIMAGASKDAIEKGSWLLQEMSAPSKLFIVEGGIGAGSNMKMVHQVLAAIQIASTSEAYGFAARLGLNGNDVKEKVVASKGWSWMFENRSLRTLTEDYFPGASAIGIIMKDTGIITSMARLHNFPSALVQTAEQIYFSAADRGWTTHDDASIIRLWTDKPVSSIDSSNLSPDEKESRLALVINLLQAIHFVAAVESLSYAKHVNIPLQQLYELASEAAGGSSMFREFGPAIIEALEGKGDGQALGSYLENLKVAVEEAQKIKCPLFLGSGALNQLLAAGKGTHLGGLTKIYTV